VIISSLRRHYPVQVVRVENIIFSSQPIEWLPGHFILSVGGFPFAVNTCVLMCRPDTQTDLHRVRFVLFGLHGSKIIAAAVQPITESAQNAGEKVLP